MASYNNGGPKSKGVKVRNHKGKLIKSYPNVNDLKNTKGFGESVQSGLLRKRNDGDYQYTKDPKTLKRGGMTNQDLNKIQAANENKNVMFGIMKDAYDRRNKKRAGAKKMGMGGTCPPKVIQGKSLR
jgi:hypothetical protein